MKFTTQDKEVLVTLYIKDKPAIMDATVIKSLTRKGCIQETTEGIYKLTNLGLEVAKNIDITKFREFESEMTVKKQK